MEENTIYILVAVLSLCLLAALLMFKRGQINITRPNPLSGFSFALVITGIMFGEDRLVGYSLMGAGILLAFIIMLRSRRKNEGQE